MELVTNAPSGAADQTVIGVGRNQAPPKSLPATATFILSEAGRKASLLAGYLLQHDRIWVPDLAFRHLRFVGARSVDLRHGGTHRAEVGADLAAVVDDVEEDAPGDRRGRTGAADEGEGAGPGLRVGGGQPADDVCALGL